MSAIKRSVRSTSSSGAEGVSELWRGYVVEVFEDGTASVVVPRLSGDDPVGRIPSLVRNLAIDARVIVGAIEGRIEDLVVMSAVSTDGLVIGDARFTDVLLDNAPTDAAHATRKDYVDAQIVTRALASHTHGLSTLTGNLNFSQLPLFIEIGNAVDLNSYITDGVWHQSANAEAVTGVNYPIALAGLLIVRVSGNFVYQTFFVYNSGRVYNRTKYNSTWYPWQAGAWTSELVNVTTSTNGFMLATDKVKLDGATSAATNNALAMRSSTGTIQVSAPSVGGDAANKTYVDAQIATRATSGHVHSFAEITGTVSTAQLPPLAINDVFAPVADQTAMLALTAQRGDMAIRADNGRTYVLSSDSPATLADWKEVMAAGQVQSVAGKTGLVTLVKADVGLSAVDNTSDLSKPISTATQTALNGKANSTHTHVSADITDLKVAAITALLVTAAPNAYPLGFSYFTIATDGTWPTSFGVVQTVRQAAARSWQLLVEKTSGRAWTRAEGDSNVWGAWAESATKAQLDAAVAADHTFGKLRLTATGDASATSTGHAFQIGPDALENVIIDQNEIIARDNGVITELYVPGGITTTTVLTSADSLTRKDYVDAATADIGAATSTVVLGTLARRSASDGGIQFFRVVSTDTGNPGSSHLVRRDWVDANKQPIKVDSGWVSTGVTLSMGAGFTLNSYDIRKIDNEVWLEASLTYSGSTLTAASDGNIGDTTMFTAPTGYRPVGGNGWQIESIRVGTGSAWFGYITTGGAFQLAYGIPGLTVVSGAGVVVRARYLTD
jgi:hypothetical protein